MKMQKPISMSFVKWTSIYFAGWAACQAVFLALVALILDVRIRSLGVPYLLLLWCGYVGAVLIYWARQSYERPKSGAIRFAVAIFGYLTLYMGILVFSAYRLHLLSLGAALYDYGPDIVPGAALGSIVVYVMARRRLEAISQSTTEAGP